MNASGSASPRFLVVDTANPSTYATIRAAVAEAEPGDTVLARPGVYREFVKLNSAISVVGDGSRDSVVVAGEGRPAFSVTGTGGARIADLTVVEVDGPHALDVAAATMRESSSEMVGSCSPNPGR